MGIRIATASEGNTVTGILIPYKDTYELCPITVSGMTTGITALAAAVGDDNAPVYNLSGQRVGEDYKGIVIKRGKKYIVR